MVYLTWRFVCYNIHPQKWSRLQNMTRFKKTDIPISNSPRNLKRTERFHSWMFVSSVITTHFQLLYTIKRLSLVFTPSGTPLLLGSIRSISSEHLPIVAYASVQNPLYCSPLYPISRIPCFIMVIREALLTTMLMMYFTNIRTGLHKLLSQFLRKM